MVPLARNHSRLVYLQTTVVGPSLSRLLRPSRGSEPRCTFSCTEKRLSRVLKAFVQPNDGKNWVVGRDLEEATRRAEAFAGSTPFTLEQDEDVLDTWFSSGLWPFSLMGWPEQVRLIGLNFAHWFC